MVNYTDDRDGEADEPIVLVDLPPPSAHEECSPLPPLPVTHDQDVPTVWLAGTRPPGSDAIPHDDEGVLTPPTPPRLRRGGPCIWPAGELAGIFGATGTESCFYGGLSIPSDGLMLRLARRSWAHYIPCPPIRAVAGQICGRCNYPIQVDHWMRRIDEAGWMHMGPCPNWSPRREFDANRYLNRRHVTARRE
jgi:hypothetical protein